MTDLVAQVAAQTEDHLVHPATGELIPIRDAAQVAQFLADIRDHARQVQEARKHAEQVLAYHAAQIGARTFDAGGHKIEVRDQDRIVWDIEVLEQLLDLGLPEQRWNELVTQTVENKVNTRVAQQIAKSGNDEFRQVIEKAQTREPGNLYVKVSP